MLGPLLAHHAPATRVAFGARGARSAADLCQDAARVATALGAAKADAQTLLFLREDRYLFAAALIGALQAGYVPVVATDTSRETALALVPQAQHILHDTLSGAPVRVDRLLAETAVDAPALDAPLLDPTRTVRLQGPDHRGGFECVERTLEQLLQETDAVGEALGYHNAGLVSGLPPGHPFGLILGVLLPLLRGGAMLREVPRSPAALGEAVATWPDAWLACVPAQLAELERTGQSPGPRRVCTTALRDAALRTRSEQRLGCAVDELVIDSPVGCALVRRGGDSSYTPLPGVHAHAGRGGWLQVAAPWLPAGEPARATGLCVQPDDSGGFHYRGRREEQCAVGDHALDLSELDCALRALPGVDDALWLSPARGPHAGRLLLAVVADGLTEDAIADAARALIASRTGAQDTSAAAEPARVVCVDAIPHDSLGTPLRGAEALRHFGLTATGERRRLDVEWLAAPSEGPPSAGRHVEQARVPEDYAYFEGHFPGYPILPGAAQLGELVLPCVRRARPELGPLTGMSRLKFLGRIRPGDTVSVSIEWTADAPQADFTVRCQGKTCAAGRLVFGPPD